MESFVVVTMLLLYLAYRELDTIPTMVYNLGYIKYVYVTCIMHAQLDYWT